MYLWDANILRAFGQGHATLRSYLLRVPWSEIARAPIGARDLHLKTLQAGKR